jgi:hypothetical protein
VIVVAFGAIFTLFTSVALWLDSRFTASSGSSEAFSTAGRAVKAGLTACDIVSEYLCFFHSALCVCWGGGGCLCECQTVYVGVKRPQGNLGGGGDAGSSEAFSTAGRAVKAGLTACDIVSEYSFGPRGCIEAQKWTCVGDRGAAQKAVMCCRLSKAFECHKGATEGLKTH